MRILITADWQADFDNLELCKRAAEEVLLLAKQLRVDVIVVAGDLKHQYNPVDVRVTNFWIRTIKMWRKAGLEVVICLGNHDRVGMHVDKQNWLPVMREAGALAYDEISFAKLGNGHELAVLPFRNNPVLLRRDASDLAKNARAGQSVLIFHADLRGAKYNVLDNSASSQQQVRVHDLCNSKYLFCIGGHIHYQHRVEGNTWYVGSPFATDWGEANQRKGYILIDTAKRELKQFRSKIPGWYDPSWPNFEETSPSVWRGTKVRIKVECDGVQHVREKLEVARAHAAAKYPDAELYVIPEFLEKSTSGSGRIKASYTDEKKIRLYLQKTLPDELKQWKPKVQHFLIEQLAQVGGLQRAAGQLYISRTKAVNFLSYKHLDIRFEPGLHVISGENRDWKGRSNGTGKTNYLQPLAVTFFGQTFKDQKHDAWMRRGKGKKLECWAKTWFTDAQHRQCSVKRARKPRELTLRVGGHVEEAGNRPESTQKLIEQVTGYTWETLANAIYIDQSRSHLMLTGTESERKNFLARLQNLERFERAEKRVKDQKSDLESRFDTVCNELAGLCTEENGLRTAISEAKRILAINENLKVSYRRAKKAYFEARYEYSEWNKIAKKKMDKLDRLEEATEKQKSEWIAQRARVQERLAILKQRIIKSKNLRSECPTCFQPVDQKLAKRHRIEWTLAITSLSNQLLGFEQSMARAEAELEELGRKKKKYRKNPELANKEWNTQREWERQKDKKVEAEKHEQLFHGIEKQIEGNLYRQEKLKKRKQKLDRWLNVLRYSMTVFRRDGLPAYLNEQICPQLNQAAAEYAELFAQKEIQVRFEIDKEGRMDVQVINAHGGESVEDQSEGEMKMASLITSFAVRSAAPKTNLLILDEPGDGLDATSARAFARGLRQVLDRFETILLTTHNPAILSELSDAKLVKVVKQNGISQVT